MLILETPTWQGILQAALPIAYAGILSCGVAYTMQIVGQKHTPPAIAAIIMSLEGVFAVLGGAMLLSQIPSLSEILGCLLMFVATVLSQVGGKEDPPKKTE
jgi:drug/metabolite transporter (DMT)-like permease